MLAWTLLCATALLTTIPAEADPARPHRVAILVDKDCPASGCEPGEHSERGGANEASVRVLYREGQRWTVRRVWQAFYGAAEGDKAFLGDQRTPEGLYFLTHVWQSDKPWESVGGWFLKLDYPTAADTAHARSLGRRAGDGIGFHGGAPGATHGCIRVVASRSQRSGYGDAVLELKTLVATLWRETQDQRESLAVPVLVVPDVDARCSAEQGSGLTIECSWALDRLLTGATRDHRPEPQELVQVLANIDRLAGISWQPAASPPELGDDPDLAEPPSSLRRTAAVAEASSVLAGGCRVPGSSDLVDCSASLLFDRSDKTAWCEGEVGHGLGAQLVMLPIAQGPVEGLLVQNGYAKSSKTFTRNGRVAAFRISDAERHYRYTLDAADSDPVEILFPEALSGEITLEILGVHPGSHYQDTCISELEFLVQAPAVAESPPQRRRR